MCPDVWGFSKYCLYKWVKLFGEPTRKRETDLDAENRRLKRELARMTEERDIPRKATAYFARRSR